MKMESYTHILVDDVHTRKLNIEFILILLKELKSQNTTNFPKIILLSDNSELETWSK